ncbi:hypothetical protein PP639_gp005 [Arthrobacter phage Seahorse]|uniref:Uncharacterized protein n=1 Tax=Arthrobacter phage Seahorse TaxID=2419611 RepID=A0A3G3M538_9CAUD|nr:hypothetical protein PP639_gp005 [Arthrobacter phage Seahorse]AYR01506.1 hypothetical protein PBI_SEAHORSE_5 [Arthrobacter phage Seahorse]
MGEFDQEALEILADAGITGEDARTALASIGRLLDAGAAELGADAGRVAAVLAARE